MVIAFVTLPPDARATVEFEKLIRGKVAVLRWMHLRDDFGRPEGRHSRSSAEKHVSRNSIDDGTEGSENIANHLIVVVWRN